MQRTIRPLIYGTLCCWLGLSACEKEQAEPSKVDEDLQPYFERFDVEARARGLDFSLEMEELEADILGIDQDGVLGQCHYSDQAPNIVEVDDQFWARATDLEKEYVVFHELGHCVLGKDHNDDRNTDGTCSSIMQSGLTSCRVTYNSSNRESYLDELFE
ncbi:MAG: hypothetical protein KTR30_03780 [Saprospiraceae bacterium]|nr:hypothetical protein [Saprospiraceae bacterium]